MNLTWQYSAVATALGGTYFSKTMHAYGGPNPNTNEKKVFRGKITLFFCIGICHSCPPTEQDCLFKPLYLKMWYNDGSIP